MAQERHTYTVLCADPSPRRLEELTERLEREGFAVIRTESAAQCLAIAAEHKPKVVILDSDLLRVDQENMAEFISCISSARVVLTDDDASRWQDRRPLYVRAVAARGDFDAIVSLVHQLR